MKVPGFLKQTALLIFSQVIVIIAGFGIKTIQTQTLGADLYGEYAFFGSLTGFLIIFFRFGFFNSMQVLLAATNAENELKRLVSAGLVLAIINGLAFAALLFGISFFINEWFNTIIGDYLKLLAPITFILPFRHYIYGVSVGLNRMRILALFDGGSKVLFFLILLSLLFLERIDLTTVIFFNLISTIAILAFIIRMLPLSTHQLGLGVKELWSKVKSYGFNSYLGFISHQSTYKLDELLITYFQNVVVNGFYTVAGLLCSPMVMFSQSLSNSLFKRFSKESEIPKKIFILNAVALIGYIIGLWLFGRWAIELLFGDEFAIAATYLIPLSIAYFLQGLYQPYMFLASKSQDKSIRNSAFAEAGVNVIGNVALIPLLGVMGAIYTSIVAKGVYLAMSHYYYKQYLKKEKEH